MCKPAIYFFAATCVFAQQTVTVPAGVPLRIAIEQRVPIKTAGTPIEGRLIEPVYIHDRIALPAGTIVQGRIAEIGKVPTRRRVNALLSGNFTPFRDVTAQFDTAVVSGGTQLELTTTPVEGVAKTRRIAKRGLRAKVAELNNAAKLAFKTPGKMKLVKERLLEMLPYRRQYWNPGTLFTASLATPISVTPMAIDANVGDPNELTARLLAPINSAAAKKGDAIEAVVTRPVFAADKSLLIPEGARLTGEITEAEPARPLHRNGKLNFVFRRLTLPTGASQNIQGYLEGLDASFESNIELSNEGATLVRSPKSRFIFPAIAVAAAGLSLHQDYENGVPEQDYAGRAQSGVVGLGLIGTGLAQISRTVASSIAFTGAGWSVYNTFLSKGQQLRLPVNTSVTISISPRKTP